MTKRKVHHDWQLLLFGLLILAVASCRNKPKYPGPLSPEESIQTFHFVDSFKAEVYAAEPLVKDPISMVFNNKGDAYVVEMPDANMPDSLKGHCRVVLLKDLDGNGRADTSIVFADGFRDATTILPWKDGLLLTTAPYILYLKDTDGDGKADNTDTLFSGFFTHNDEAQITSLRFGVDNWIYANNTGEPGEVSSHRDPDAPELSMQGADFRFRMDKKEFERTTGPGQYGLALDDWGHRFFTKNSLHIQQVVLPWRYAHRNPYMPPEANRDIKNISDHDPIMFQLTPAPYWRQVRTERRNKKSKEHGLPPTEYAKDHFTGASGGTFYGGDALGKGYYGSIFTGEVAGNLIHRDVLVSSSDKFDPFYTAKRGSWEEKQEFMAATDSWFRPTTFAVGPDGYLYVVDMYRQHIETPVSIPEDLQEDMNFTEGSNKGRIYRIVPKDEKGYKKMNVDLNAMSSDKLVSLLSNSNRWYRRHAHKLLVERQDKTVVPIVKKLFKTADDPRTRISALFVLEGLSALNANIVEDALQDAAPGLRENAAILAERFPSCLPELRKLVDDSSSRVAFQATLSLGQFSGDKIIDDLTHVLRRYGTNSWFREAVLSSKPGSSVEILTRLTSGDGLFTENPSWKGKFISSISYIIGGRNKKKEVSALLDLPIVKKDQEMSTQAVKGLIKGLSLAEKKDSVRGNQLAAIQEKVKASRAEAIEDLKRLFN